MSNECDLLYRYGLAILAEPRNVNHEKIVGGRWAHFK